MVHIFVWAVPRGKENSASLLVQVQPTAMRIDSLFENTYLFHSFALTLKPSITKAVRKVQQWKLLFQSNLKLEY